MLLSAVRTVATWLSRPLERVATGSQLLLEVGLMRPISAAILAFGFTEVGTRR